MDEREEFSSENRRKYVGELERFIGDTENDLRNIVCQLGWTVESIDKDSEEIIECPFFPSHRIPVRTLDKHLEKCQWKAEGYSESDKPFSIPYTKSNIASSVVFDEELQAKIFLEAKQKDPNLKIGVGDQLIPRTSDRLFSDFTSDERRVLYDYAVSHTVKPDIGKDIPDLKELKNELTLNDTSPLELMVQERNLRRRRTRHRGVHTNKKSQVEILREVIDQQMELYTELVYQKNGGSGKNEPVENRVEDRKSYINPEYRPKTEKYQEMGNGKSFRESRISSRECDKESRRSERTEEKTDYKEKHSRRSRSKSRSKLRSRSRSRSRSKHKKKSKHRSKDREERKKKKRSRSRSRERRRHKSHKERR